MGAEAGASLLVVLKGVRKEYHLGQTTVAALSDVTLSIERGFFASIAGPSGSGKTTLLNIIGCLDEPTAGNVFIAGQDVAEYSDNELSHFRAHKLGFIFQSFNLIPVLDVYENIEYPLRLNGTHKKELRERTWEVIEAVGLTAQSKQRPNQLSGGQRQRVAVARALVTRPELVLADEPTANLDTETGERVLDLMKRMRARFATTFLFSTHDSMMAGHAEQHFTMRDGALNGSEPLA
ncbi:MAG: ABC transporter ATP-binding protein [Verrucomicrobiota bacterium]|nr:ABC transporter ATP-binding protein [Verrucomicrobiota bacterium]